MNILQEIIVQEYERAEKLNNIDKRWQLDELARERNSRKWQKATQLRQLFHQLGKIRIQVSFEVNEPCLNECNART